MTQAFHYLEGATPLDPDEIEGLCFKHVTTRKELDALEQANVDSGLQWLKKQRRKHVLNKDFVCDLHQQLFGQVWSWAGKFRHTEKNIGVDPTQITVQLHNLLNNTSYWVKERVYEPK